MAFAALRQEVRDARLRAKEAACQIWTEDQGTGFWLRTRGQLGTRVAWYPGGHEHFRVLGAKIVHRAHSATFDASPPYDDVLEPFVRLWRCRGPVLERRS